MTSPTYCKHIMALKIGTFFHNLLQRDNKHLKKKEKSELQIHPDVTAKQLLMEDLQK